MDTKVVSTLLVIMVAGMTGGYGVMAWFSDSAESAANILDAAKVDLRIDGQESITAFVSGTNMLPDECVSGTTTLTNVGDRTGSVLALDISIEYTDTDDMAKYLEVKDLDYGTIHTNLQGSIPDENGNGWKDLHDWEGNAQATQGLTEPGAAGTGMTVMLCLRPEADNHLQSDSVTVDFTFRLRQSGEPVGQLVGHWAFDAGSGTVAADSSGRGNQGTLTNGPTWTTGKVGGALRFDGTNDYVVIPDAASLDLTQYTAAAWVKRESGADVWHTVLAKGPWNQPSENYGMFVHRDGAHVHHTYNTNGVRHHFDTPGGVAPSGVWVHVAITFDGTTARTYVDGVQKASQSFSGSVTTNDFPLRIGHRDGETYYWKGLIDEVRVYNGALSASQIAALAAV